MDLAELRRKLRVYYSDIIRGYSYSKEFDLYIKHFNDNDISIVEYELDEYSEKARANGLLVEAEKIQECIKNKNWTPEEEAEFKSTKKFIDNQSALKEKVGNLEKHVYEKNIDEAHAKLSKIENRRKSILGVTLEDHLIRKHSDLNIYHSFYTDTECKEQYFTEETFEYIDQVDLNNLIAEYNLVFQNFDSRNIQRIATQPYFLNKYFLSTGDPRIFFDKTVLELTIFQSELLSQGKMYKNLLENSKDGITPPATWYDDPDKLVNWYYSQAKMGQPGGAKSTADKAENDEWVGGTSQPGLDKKEMESRREGGEDIVDLASELEKVKDEKGDFDIYDLLRIHNVDCSNIDPVEKEKKHQEILAHNRKFTLQSAKEGDHESLKKLKEFKESGDITEEEAEILENHEKNKAIS